MSRPEGNLRRFSGFADLYDAVRPSPPSALGPLLCAYCGSTRPAVVDLGSGSGLSTRWAATWAGSVIGIEPNDDMRTVAESRPVPGATFRKGTADDAGLPAGSADVVLAVQALHWMDPGPTLAEVARLLRPGGVMAAIDADWPPVAGSPRAEAAWEALDRRFASLEERLVTEADGPDQTGAPGPDAPDAAGASAPGAPEERPDGERRRPDGVRSWDKAGHLARMASSGWFAFTREVALSEVEPGGAERFVALLRSQGTYQLLRRLGTSDADLGMDEFEREVRAGLEAVPGPTHLSFSWRVRLGIRGR
jgi:SAM-dependent methyltransferase